MEHLDTLWLLAKEHLFLAAGVVVLILIELIHRASLIVDLLIALVRGLKGALRTLKRKLRKLWREITQWDPLPEPDDPRSRETDKLPGSRAVEPSPQAARQAALYDRAAPVEHDVEMSPARVVESSVGGARLSAARMSPEANSVDAMSAER